MKVYSEINLSDFEFWSGGADRAKMLTSEQLDQVGRALEIENPDGLSDTEINDLFWFDFEFICSLIGLQYDSQHDRIIDPDEDEDEEDEDPGENPDEEDGDE